MDHTTAADYIDIDIDIDRRAIDDSCDAGASVDVRAGFDDADDNCGGHDVDG